MKVNKFIDIVLDLLRKKQEKGYDLTKVIREIEEFYEKEKV